MLPLTRFTQALPVLEVRDDDRAEGRSVREQALVTIARMTPEELRTLAEDGGPREQTPSNAVIRTTRSLS